MSDARQLIPIADKAALDALCAITFEATTFDHYRKNWRNHAIVTDDHVAALKKAVGITAIKLAGGHKDGAQHTLTFDTNNEYYPGSGGSKMTIVYSATAENNDGEAFFSEVWKWA